MPRCLRCLPWLLLVATLSLAAPDPKLFRTPPRQYRPWTVWWWFGNASTGDDLKAELGHMDAVGIGGAEIVPVYPLDRDDPTRGIENVPLYSPAWTERFRAALSEAEKRGMAIVLRGGAGWPLGGPWVTEELSAKAVARAFLDVTGPATLAGRLPRPIAPQGWTTEGVERVVAVERKSNQRVILPVPQDGRWQGSLPAGTWRVHVIYRMRTNQEVERASPGGAGRVLDHFQAPALEPQLARLQTLLPIAKAAAPKAFAGFAADSLELDDSNWTNDLLAEFQRRCGYDLTPHLPDLWERLRPETAAVRQDFFRTLSELQLERYFRPYTAFAERNGLRSFVQAHGSLADVIAAYGAVSVPDGETIWPGQDQPQVNMRNRRLASSAAHLYGKPFVTAESYTWLRMPRFLVTPAMVKAASDAIYLDGIEHIKNHGYSSSPERLGKPGWVFYASTMLNHNQTWWPHYPPLAAYVGRMNYLMRSLPYHADVALYHNLDDARARADEPKSDALGWEGNDDAWHRPALNPGLDSSARIARLINDTAARLQNAGYGFDVVNDEALVGKLQPAQGRLRAPSGTAYRVLLFSRPQHVPLATLRRVRDLAKQGVRVIAVGGPPRQGVGLTEFGQEAEIRALSAEIWGPLGGKVVPDLDALAALLDEQIKPDFRAAAANVPLHFLHRQAAGRDLYLVVNGSANPVETDVRLRSTLRVVERWNAMDGTVARVSGTAMEGQHTRVPVRLGPFESAVLMLSSAPSSGATPPRAPLPPSASAHAVTGPWQVTFPEPAKRSYAWAELVPWSTRPELREFSGVAAYRATITLPATFRVDRPAELDLGALHESAEVLVNGKSAGIAFLPPFRLRVDGLLRAGANDIEIRVANLWNANVRSRNPVSSVVPERGYSITDVLYGPRRRPDLPSGLLGPVRVWQ